MQLSVVCVPTTYKVQKLGLVNSSLDQSDSKYETYFRNYLLRNIFLNFFFNFYYSILSILNHLYYVATLIQFCYFSWMFAVFHQALPSSFFFLAMFEP